MNPSILYPLQYNPSRNIQINHVIQRPDFLQFFIKFLRMFSSARESIEHPCFAGVFGEFGEDEGDHCGVWDEAAFFYDL